MERPLAIDGSTIVTIDSDSRHAPQTFRSSGKAMECPLLIDGSTSTHNPSDSCSHHALQARKLNSCTISCRKFPLPRDQHFWLQLSDDGYPCSGPLPNEPDNNLGNHVVWGALEQSSPYSSDPSTTPRSDSVGSACGLEEQAQVATGTTKSWSEGAALHASGNCQPCGFVWKQRGCSKGEMCTFCHLCGRQDFKRFERRKASSAKTKRKGRRPHATQALSKGEEHSGLSEVRVPVT